MIVLNQNEENEYRWIKAAVAAAGAGSYVFRDFCGSRPVCPRIARRFFEEVEAGRWPSVKLAGTLAREGYQIN